MLTIRLSRIGKKKKPMYRLVISEKARDPYGRALEILGSWNPFTKELVAKKDRIEHWLKNGAQMSATVNNLLIDKEIIKGDKVRAYSPKKKKGEKKDEAAKPEAKVEPKAEKETPADNTPEKKEEVKEVPKEEPKKEEPKEEKSSPEKVTPEEPKEEKAENKG